jgi:hypothetical protein
MTQQKSQWPLSICIFQRNNLWPGSETSRNTCNSIVIAHLWLTRGLKSQGEKNKNSETVAWSWLAEPAAAQKNPSRLFLLFWPLICHNDYHIQRQLSLVHSIVIKAIRYSLLPRYFQIKSNMPNAFHSRWKCFWQQSGHVHLTEAYFGFGGWIKYEREWGLFVSDVWKHWIQTMVNNPQSTNSSHYLSFHPLTIEKKKIQSRI